MKKYIEKIIFGEEEIKITLSCDGLKYGKTKEGSKKLAKYATEKYQKLFGKKFCRDAFYGWDSVSKEIYDHSYWSLSKIWSKIPQIKKRANPINIKTKDKPPFWH